MPKGNKIRPFPKRKVDVLDELLEQEGTDEMGLLDLVFVEEILNQKKQDKAS